MTWSIDKVACLIFNNLTIAAYPFYLFHVPGGYWFAAEPCSRFFPEFNLAAAYFFFSVFRRFYFIHPAKIPALLFCPADQESRAQQEARSRCGHRRTRGTVFSGCEKQL